MTVIRVGQNMNHDGNGGYASVQPLGLVVVGGGPAGLALILAARQSGLLPELVKTGFRIIERTQVAGSGELGDYLIRSDSLSGRFLEAAEKPGEPNLEQCLAREPGLYLRSRRSEPADLWRAAQFLTDLAGEFRRQFSETCGFNPFVLGTNALRASRDRDGLWVTTCRDSGGGLITFRSRNVVLATGGHQPADRLFREPIAGTPLLPRFTGKTLQSSSFLRPAGFQAALRLLTGIRDPKVAIVGGSHSAMASALVCLGEPSIRLGSRSVTVLHRGSLRLTYASPLEAWEDGFRSFGTEDICPQSGRVFPLAGFRSDCRDLLRRHWELGGLKSDGRLHLFKIQRDNHETANKILSEADLIIAALGYRPRALPLFSCEGKAIDLLADQERRPLVDSWSRVLDAERLPVPGMFAIGLSSGYPLAGVHGEPSFRGEANGVALWQSDIGKQILMQILKNSESVIPNGQAVPETEKNELYAALKGNSGTGALV